MKKWFFSLIMLGYFWTNAFSQQTKIDSVSCTFKEHVPEYVKIIQASTYKIQNSDEACTLALIDSLLFYYQTENDIKYLSAISAICNREIEGLGSHITSIIEQLVEADFEKLINDFYLSKGLCPCLEKELIGELNTIIQGKPLKTKYQGRLDVEIEKAVDKKDVGKSSYLKKLKQRIETERY